MQLIEHKGNSINKARQSGPHAHSLILDKENKYAFAADLEIDKLMIYRTDFDGCGSILSPQITLDIFPGTGPRLCEFDANFQHCYVMNELASSISVFDYDSTGKLSLKQTISTLGEPFAGENTCADIHLTSDGRFLYCSNRSHNSRGFQIGIS